MATDTASQDEASWPILCTVYENYDIEAYARTFLVGYEEMEAIHPAPIFLFCRTGHTDFIHPE
ncbi:MAG: hypothetical protein CL946_08690 [Ectothiorhodospiraceae bacterium]|nr:hypothetical protein [Ectothiorhodospiraceae bacterium]